MRDSYADADYSAQQALEKVLDLNEKVVSRCGMLVHFSSVLIVLFMFVVKNSYVLPLPGHRTGFYIAMFFWVTSTMILLWSLKHMLPRADRFGTEQDFDFTARIYYRRMGIYNVALITAILAFGIIVILLAPVHLDINFIDQLFGPRSTPQAGFRAEVRDD